MKQKFENDIMYQELKQDFQALYHKYLMRSIERGYCETEIKDMFLSIIHEINRKGYCNTELSQMLFDTVDNKEQEIIPKETVPSLDTLVLRALQRIGVPSHIIGSIYLREAVVLTIKDKNASCIMKYLYPVIAKKHHKKVGAVERAIRYAIEYAWEKGDEDVWYEFFGYYRKKGKKKPTNGAFILTIADIICSRQK